MTKIAYNGKHGGFSISNAALIRAREISGNPRWAGCCLKGETYSDGSKCDFDFDGHHISDYGDDKIERTDPVLIQVIEELGKEANGSCADIRIEDLPAGTFYRIQEYDGLEWIETDSSIDWKVA